jgi:hypothetical protein
MMCPHCSVQDASRKEAQFLAGVMSSTVGMVQLVLEWWAKEVAAQGGRDICNDP